MLLEEELPLEVGLTVPVDVGLLLLVSFPTERTMELIGRPSAAHCCVYTIDNGISINLDGIVLERTWWYDKHTKCQGRQKRKKD